MKKMLNGLCIATLCLLTVPQGVHAATNSAVKSNSAHEHSQGSIKDSELNNEEIKRQYQQVISRGKEEDFFKAKAGMIKAFEDAGEDLANKKSWLFKIGGSRRVLGFSTKFISIGTLGLLT